MTALAVAPRRRQPHLSRDDLVEDAAWLVETGESWSLAVVRLGYRGRPETLERRLARAGRYDLITALRAPENAWAAAQASLACRGHHH